MGRDSLLFQQHDRCFDLRVLRLDWERNGDFIDDFIGQDSWQFFHCSQPPRTVKFAFSKSRVAVDVTHHPIPEVLAQVELGGKSPTACAAANYQQSLYVVAAPAQPSQVESGDKAHA